MLISSIKCSNIKIAQHDQAWDLEYIHQGGFSLKGLHWSWEFTDTDAFAFQVLKTARDMFWAAI